MDYCGTLLATGLASPLCLHAEEVGALHGLTRSKKVFQRENCILSQSQNQNHLTFDI